MDELGGQVLPKRRVQQVVSCWMVQTGLREGERGKNVSGKSWFPNQG